MTKTLAREQDYLKELEEINKELDSMYGNPDDEDDTYKVDKREQGFITNGVKGIKTCPHCGGSRINEVFFFWRGYMKNEYWCLDCDRHYAIARNGKKIKEFSYNEDGVPKFKNTVIPNKFLKEAMKKEA